MWVMPNEPAAMAKIEPSLARRVGKKWIDVCGCFNVCEPKFLDVQRRGRRPRARRRALRLLKKKTPWRNRTINYIACLRAESVANTCSASFSFLFSSVARSNVNVNGDCTERIDRIHRSNTQREWPQKKKKNSRKKSGDIKSPKAK